MENIINEIFSYVCIGKYILLNIFQWWMKEDIVKASLQHFLIYGIRKMTLKEIIAPLGISTKTVYKYFENKEALLEECLELHYGTVHNDMIALMSTLSNPVWLISQFYIKAVELDFKINNLFYHDLNYYYPELQDKIINKEFKAAGGELLNAFKSGVEQGYFRNDISLEVIQEGLSVLYRALTRTNQFEKFNVSPFELAHNTIAIFLRGICTERGLHAIDTKPTLTSFNYKP
jgi:AcrR family transcriptional regulator